MSNNEGPKIEVPEEERAFTELLKKFGVGSKTLTAETIAENISRTGGEYVFEEPQSLAERLATWHEYISPVKRKQILEQWFAQKGVEVPEEAIKVAGVKSSDIKAKEEEEKKRKEEEEKKKAKFFVEPDTGTIRAARGEETPLTMAEAETLSDRIKKEKTEGGLGGKKGPFIIDKDGNLTIKEGAELTREDLFIWDAVTKAHERGDTRTAREIVEDEVKHFQTMQELTGGGKPGKGLFESVDDMIKFKELFATDEETKNLLAGIYKELKEGGASKGASEEVKTLTDKLDKLTEELHKKELERRDEQIGSLTTEISNLRGDLTKAVSEARAKDEYGIMGEALKIIDRRLGAIEGLARARLGSVPPLLPEGEKAELTEVISAEAAAEEELNRLAEEAFYPH